jgi:O-methyltransferase involved in polyketide biosynthesis
VKLLPEGLSGVQWTLLIPLLSRARITMTYGSLLNDPTAVQIVELLSGRLSVADDVRLLYNDIGNAARARVLDDAARAFIDDHPKAKIVNLGSGFETAFSRIDNGQISWFDVDLPAVIEMRKVIIPETDRSRCIACSILDNAWMREINPDKNGLFMIAGGVMPYFTKQEVKGVCASLAGHFPSGELVFDAVSWFCRVLSNRRIKKAGISSASMKWSAGRRNNVHAWDSRAIVLHHYPMFAHIGRSSGFDEKIVRIMDRCDKRWDMSIFHLRFCA